LRAIQYLCLLIMPFFIYAQKAEDFSTVIEEISEVVSESNESGRPVRLAVMTFISTSTIDKNDFGMYFTESLISAFAENSKKFKIFERKRLDVILQENALNMSGLIDAKQALKLGELAPIDFIFSGTYTKLKTTISINGRLIDVVTGEILSSYSGSIKITPDIDALFITEVVNKPQVDPCIQKQQEIENLLNDLSTPEKVQYLVEKAVKIPFDVNCGKIHYNIIYDFERYKIENSDYKSFLFKTLESIDFPGNDSRAREILSFFKRDDDIDDTEWQHGLDVLKKVGDYTLNQYIRILLSPKETSIENERTFSRIDEFFDLVKKNKVGLPVPINFNFAFSQMIDAFDHLNTKDNILPSFVYQKYYNDTEPDDKLLNTISGVLKRMYLREQDTSEKLKFLDWIADFYNGIELSSKLADHLFDFVKNFEMTGYKEDHPEEIKKAPPEHLKIFVNKTASRLCDALSLAEYKSTKEERTDFCLENNIPCPGVIPTVDECIAAIKSDDYYKKERAFEILEKMGAKAAPAEDAVRVALGTDDLANETENSILQKYAATILGNIRTKNAKSIESLIKALGSLNYRVPDIAQEALVKIGNPAVPYLMKELNSKFGGVQYKVVVTLGMIGKDAKEAIKPLEKMYSETNNSAVYRAIEIALKSIKN